MERLVWIAKWAQLVHLRILIKDSDVSKLEREICKDFSAGFRVWSQSSRNTGEWPVGAGKGTAKISLSPKECLEFGLSKIYSIHLASRTVKLILILMTSSVVICSSYDWKSTDHILKSPSKVIQSFFFYLCGIETLAWVTLLLDQVSLFKHDWWFLLILWDLCTLRCHLMALAQTVPPRAWSVCHPWNTTWFNLFNWFLCIYSFTVLETLKSHEHPGPYQQLGATGLYYMH